MIANFNIRQYKSAAVHIIGYAIVALVVIAPALLLAQPTSAQDLSENSVKCGSGVQGLGGGTPNKCNEISGEGTKIQNLIATIINVISVLVGSIAIIMIIVGGFRYVTAGGDTNNVSGAKNTILYAVVGLIVVAFAQVIVQFVLLRSTGNGFGG